jgi:outer membrane protein OmpA-like peptidoglycan-associated protein
MKRVFILLMVLLLSSSIFADTNQHRSLIDAAQSYEVGNYEQALNTMNRIESVYHGTPEYALLMGKILLELGDYMNAYNWLTEYAVSYMGKEDIVSEELLQKIYEAGLYQEISPVAVSLGRLAGNINSIGSEYAPVLADEGRTIIFGSNRRSIFDRENIFISEFINQRWTDPIEIKELCTDRNETVGSISKDGTTLYISGQYDRRERTSNIYKSNLRYGYWEKPEMIASVSSRFHDIQPFVYNEQAMFFTSNRLGNNRNYDIFVSEKIGGMWQTPVSIGEVINTGYDEQTPFLSPDGQTLYFSSNGHPGYGGFDIFKAERKDDTWTNWTKPENLGPIINSNRDDRYFFISPDDRYAYMSSSRFDGIGQEDIYYIDLLKLREMEQMIADMMLKDIVEEYDIEVNGIVVDEVNNPVSTEIKWTYIHEDTINNIEIISAEDGTFNLSVPYIERLKYHVEAPGYAVREEILVVPSHTAAFNVTIRLVSLENEMKISGIVTDTEEQGLRAMLTWSYTLLDEVIDYHVISNHDGHYSISLPLMSQINYRVEKNNYLPISGTMVVPEDESSLTRDFTMLRLAADEIFTIDNILFEFAKADLLPESYRVIDPIATMMKNNPSLRIELAGHTDIVGSREVNMRLSRDRAQSVADYLIGQDIDRYRIEIEGYGFDRPIADNDTPEGRALNRRVEMTILGIEYLDEEDDDPFIFDNMLIPRNTPYLVRPVQPTDYLAIEELPAATKEHLLALVIEAMGDEKANLKVDLLLDNGTIQSLKLTVLEGHLAEATISEINNRLLGWKLQVEGTFVHSLVVENM